MEVEIEIPEELQPTQEIVTQILIDKLVAQAGDHVREYLALGRVVAALKDEMLDEGRHFGMGLRAVLPGQSKKMEDKIIRLIVGKIYELAAEDLKANEEGDES
jgi:hypothetical protein